MFFIVSYDIPSSAEGDKRRTRVAKKLLGLGLRVQWSVFELEMPPERISHLLADLRDLIDEREDSIRIYPMCASCRKGDLRLGKSAPVEHDPLLIW